MMARMGAGGGTGGDAITAPDLRRRLRHDIREQSTAISWAAAELLEDGEASPRQLALLTAIADAAAALVRLADERLT
jgi:hypothetical protein